MCVISYTGAKPEVSYIYVEEDIRKTLEKQI